MKVHPRDRLSLSKRRELPERIVGDLAPGDALMWNRLAGTCYALGRYDDAIRYAQQASALKEYDKPLVNMASVYHHRGLLKHHLGRYGDAEGDYAQAERCLDRAMALGGETSVQKEAADDRRANEPFRALARER